MTRAQKRQLRAYLFFKNRPMTVVGLARFNWRQLVGMYSFIAIATTYFMASGNAFWGTIYIAGAVTVFLRDLGNFIRWSRSWPVTHAVLNWVEVERLAAEHGIAA